MKGKKSSCRFRQAGGVILCFLGVLCFFYGFRLCGALQKNPGASVFLSGMYPDKGQVTEMIEKERRAETPTDVCFYWEGGISVLQSQKYGTQKEAMVCGLLGDASLFDGRVQGFSKEDREGCIIDEKTSCAFRKQGGGRKRASFKWKNVCGTRYHSLETAHDSFPSYRQ